MLRPPSEPPASSARCTSSGQEACSRRGTPSAVLSRTVGWRDISGEEVLGELLAQKRAGDEQAVMRCGFADGFDGFWDLVGKVGINEGTMAGRLTVSKVI